MQLTPHFSLEELTRTDHRGLDNTAPVEVLPNLYRLAEFLEQVKEYFNGAPVVVNSGYRSKAVNDAVGSKDTSQHRQGTAADIRIPGYTPDQVVRRLKMSSLPYDQLIREFDSWTHVSIPNNPVSAPRQQVLIIDRAGTRVYG